MSLRNTNFENWRLSRIEEEIERLSYSSQDTSIDDGSCSPRSAEGTLERLGCVKPPFKDDGIYSCAAFGVSGQGSVSKEEENSKDALRFIKEKYDSLGKVKIKKPSAEPQLEPSGEANSPPQHDTNNPQNNLASIVPSVTVDSAETVRVQERREERQPSSATEDAVTSSSNIRLITDQELNQVEMFYRSHKTSVFVCLCQATLYLSDPIRNSLCHISPEDHQDRGRQAAAAETRLAGWTLVKSGIPVLVLDSGESHRQRRLHLVLAERGTGFGLWRDQIDCLSNYDAPSITFHTMQLSNDHSKLIGLRFDDSAAASDFLQHIRRLTSDSDDPLLSLAQNPDDRRKTKKWKKTDGAKRQTATKGGVVTKADISQPCCFTHITKLDHSDGSNLLRGQTSEYKAARSSPKPGSGDRHKVKLKP